LDGLLARRHYLIGPVLLSSLASLTKQIVYSCGLIDCFANTTNSLQPYLSSPLIIAE